MLWLESRCRRLDHSFFNSKAERMLALKQIKHEKHDNHYADKDACFRSPVAARRFVSDINIFPCLRWRPVMPLVNEIVAKYWGLLQPIRERKWTFLPAAGEAITNCYLRLRY